MLNKENKMKKNLLKIFTLFISLHSFAFYYDSERIEKISFQKEANYYEVVIVNKAAFYKAEEKLLSCLQKGMKENVKLEIDPAKLLIKNCQ